MLSCSRLSSATIESLCCKGEIVLSLSPYSRDVELECQQLFILKVPCGQNNPDVAIHVCLLFLGGKGRMFTYMKWGTWLCLFLETLIAVLHVVTLYCVLMLSPVLLSPKGNPPRQGQVVDIFCELWSLLHILCL